MEPMTENRDCIAEWIDARESSGSDSIAFVIRTFIEPDGIECGRFRDHKAEQGMLPAVHLSLKGGWFPISVWLILRSDEVLVWLTTRGTSEGWVANPEPLRCLTSSHPEFFDHVAQSLQRLDPLFIPQAVHEAISE